MVARLPDVLAKTARYNVPLAASVLTTEDRTANAPAMFVQVPPALVLVCHWTVGKGRPIAVAVKVTVRDGGTAVDVGLCVIDSGLTRKTCAIDSTIEPIRSRTAPVVAARAEKQRFWLVGRLSPLNCQPPAMRVALPSDV